MFYFAIVEEGGPDDAFGITFPDIPGCFSASDTEADIIKNAIEALDLWAEDSDMPSPRSIAEIRATGEHNELLAQEDTYFVRVPYVDNDGKNERYNISMRRGVMKQIDQAAAEQGMNRSAYLQHVALRDIVSRS